MLFSAEAWPGIADGSITLTFRNWTRPQAKVGGRYRIAGMLIEAVAVGQIDIGEITAPDARCAGEPTREALMARLGRDRGSVWRVEFRYVGNDDRIATRADDQLDPDRLATITARLRRLDLQGAWTTATLQMIESDPGVVSTVLAGRLRQERPVFKANVRKLKELGLTESLDVGYRLSPRGLAVLRSLVGRHDAAINQGGGEPTDRSAADR